ncbi:U6 snRNA phosphodiesterase 1 isoform X2 [Eurosta solidaginis]|uniref:U6 snRNA phosphodiesterase 1 isoform X2 n=1 Tax=Eurosta solidaginis TaxID=178769 RepID=UPI003530E425
MMALVNYDSSCSSDETIDEIDCPENRTSLANNLGEPLPKITKKGSLPGALSLLGTERATSTTINEHHDNPAEHAGRIRSFKHERGNWATYVYIAVRSEQLEDLQEVCQQVLANLVNDLHTIKDLHISLSRTVVLQYHLIDSFVESLKNALELRDRFSISFRNLHIYTNEERTRTFIAFKVDEMHFDKIHQLMSKVNGIMTDYKLQRFYEGPNRNIHHRITRHVKT